MLGGVALTCIAALCVLSRPAVAQEATGYTMHIADDRGIPVHSAQVLVTGTDGAAILFHSDDHGVVRGSGMARDSVTVLVRAVGFRPVAVPWVRGSELVVRLDRLAVALAAVEVREPDRCTDSEDARRLWFSIAGAYELPTGFRITGESQMHSARDGREQVHHADSPYGYNSRFMRSVGYELMRRRIERDGWRWPATGTSIEPAAGVFRYPRLDAEEIMIIVDPIFAETHRISLLDEAGDRVTLHFCPRDPRRRSALTGSVTMDRAERRFLYLDWRFAEERDGERAGGDVVFMDLPAPSGLRYLLPLQSSFWRSSRGVVRYERSTAFRDWVVGPDSVALP